MFTMVAEMPTDAMGLLIFVVVAVLSAFLYMVKTQTDKIAPALEKLTEAIKSLPSMIHDAIKSTRDEMMR